MKLNSSGWIHGEWPGRWRIDGQEEHHRKISFQEERIRYLKKQGIEYDGRYIGA